MRPQRLEAPQNGISSSAKSSIGAGCEAFNNKQLRNVEEFLKQHNCNLRFTAGYGSSEAGSNATLPMAPFPVRDGNVGVPMIHSVISIFKPGTQEELTYNTPGEICMTGPGVMLGYDRPEATAKALQVHADGKTWLHTGDIGYMTEDGVLYTMTRGASPRFGGGDLMVQPLENIVADAEKAYCIRNGNAMMSSITGTGCQLSALTAAFVTANPGHPLEAAAAAVCAMGLAGAVAHQRLTPQDGNATYRNYIIDAIYNMTPEQLEKGANYEVR